VVVVVVITVMVYVAVCKQILLVVALMSAVRSKSVVHSISTT
jgi:hypothetical protein